MKSSIVVTALAFFAPLANSQCIGVRFQDTTNSTRAYELKLRAGDTNVPLVTVTAFGCIGSYDCSCIDWFTVNQSGQLQKGWVCFSNPGAQVSDLQNGKLHRLRNTIQKLPTPEPIPTNIPCQRPIVLGAIKGTNWFYAVYDVGNTPPEVREIFDIVGARPPGSGNN